MLPGSTQTEANRVAKRMRSATANCLLPLVDRELQIRLQHGIAELKPNETAQELIARARLSLATPGAAHRQRLRFCEAARCLAVLQAEWYDSTALSEETRPQSNESCLIRIRSPTRSVASLVAAAPLPIQPRVAPDCGSRRGNRHGIGLVISRFHRVASLRQCLLRPADTIRDRRNLRPRRHPILCDRRLGSLANAAPLDVVDGHLAADFAPYLRHFGGGHSSLASTIWRRLRQLEHVNPTIAKLPNLSAIRG